MTFELWDTETNNIMGAYSSKAAALSVVRGAIAVHGTAYALSLALVREDKNGETTILAMGPGLAQLTRIDDPSNRDAEPDPSDDRPRSFTNAKPGGTFRNPGRLVSRSREHKASGKSSKVPTRPGTSSGSGSGSVWQVRSDGSPTSNPRGVRKVPTGRTSPDEPGHKLSPDSSTKEKKQDA